MARRLVLHIGSMKSGTSYLQALMEHNRERLRALGVDFSGDRWRQQVAAVNELIERGGEKQPPLAPDGAFERLAAYVDAWPETAVVSMEFLGPRGRPKIDLVLQRFPDTRVDVVLTARDLTRQLPAAWQEAVQNTSQVTWDDYVASVRKPAGPRDVPGKKFWRQQAVDEMAARWRAAVGHDHFTLVTVPPPGAPPSLLWERFAQVLGVPADAVELDVPRSNPSIGTAAALVMRALNERLAATDLSRDDYLAVAKGVLAKQGLVGLGDPKLGIDAPWLERRAREQVEALRALGPQVVGDLADLLPREVRGVHTRDISSEQQLDAALAGLAFMVERLVDERADNARLRRRLRRARAEVAEPSPDGTAPALDDLEED